MRGYTIWLMLRKKISLPIINLLIALATFPVFKYYANARSHAYTWAEVQRYMLIGIALYVSISVLAVIRAFLRAGEKATASARMGAEASAIGMLGAGMLENITLSLEASHSEFSQLNLGGELVVDPKRFNMPVRYGDTVGVYSGEGPQKAVICAVVDTIDGVNLRVVLKKQPSA